MCVLRINVNEMEGELAKMFDNCREPPLRVCNDFRMCRVLLEILSVYFRNNTYIDLLDRINARADEYMLRALKSNCSEFL